MSSVVEPPCDHLDELRYRLQITQVRLKCIEDQYGPDFTGVFPKMFFPFGSLPAQFFESREDMERTIKELKETIENLERKRVNTVLNSALV